jgi:hypothetical protein
MASTFLKMLITGFRENSTDVFKDLVGMHGVDLQIEFILAVTDCACRAGLDLDDQLSPFHKHVLLARPMQQEQDQGGDQRSIAGPRLGQRQPGLIRL